MRIVFEKRESISRWAIILVPIISFLVSLLFGAILLMASGVNPLETYQAMAVGAFGSGHNFSETLVKATPLLFTSLGVAIAFRMKFWNIGAEGQLVWGGVASAWVALYWSKFLPGWTVLPVALLLACVAGAIWAGIPAALKAYLNVDETLTTLMLNYVAILYAKNLYYGPWRDPGGFGFPGSAQFPPTSWLPRITGRVHLGLVIALLLAFILRFAFNRTRWGFETRIIGENKIAARYLGIDIKRNIVIALMLSGILSGLAGAGETLGIAHRLQQGLSMGYGYTAIIVAWMSQLNPLAIIFVAILMASLLVGGDQIQIMMGLPASVGVVLQGMILIPMLAGGLFTEYRLRIIRTHKTEEAQA